MSSFLALDDVTSDQLENLAPHKNMYDMKEPHKLSSAAVFPKPIAGTISNWLHHSDLELWPTTPAKSKFLADLATA